MAKDNWNREQLIVALNLYWKIPYNKISGSSNSPTLARAAITSTAEIRFPTRIVYDWDWKFNF